MRRIRTGIDERAFPFDVHGNEKVHFRASSGVKAKQHAKQEKFLNSDLAISRRQQAFHAYTFKLKHSERPQSAPVYKNDLGGSQNQLLTETAKRSGKTDGGDLPKPKMRPNSAHFLHPSSFSKGNNNEHGLEVFAAPRTERSGGGSQHVFVHPTPPTDNTRILTHHEMMFYTRHFEKLAIKKAESEKYYLDDIYNQEVRQYDNISSTIHAPSNEVVTNYRMGRRKQRFPPRVVEHRKTGLQKGRGVTDRPNNGIARNAFGGFYS